MTSSQRQVAAWQAMKKPEDKRPYSIYEALHIDGAGMEKKFLPKQKPLERPLKVTQNQIYAQSEDGLNAAQEFKYTLDPKNYKFLPPDYTG